MGAIQSSYLFPILMCSTGKTTPTMMLMLPTTRYAMPRNGFLPPNHEVVVMTNVFRPPNIVTGKAVNHEQQTH